MPSLWRPRTVIGRIGCLLEDLGYNLRHTDSGEVKKIDEINRVAEGVRRVDHPPSAP